jgi:hypothetical protein
LLSQLALYFYAVSGRYDFMLEHLDQILIHSEIVLPFLDRLVMGLHLT